VSQLTPDPTSSSHIAPTRSVCRQASFISGCTELPLPFIAMECIEGSNVKQKVESRPLPLDEALDIAIQVAQGLHGAHRRTE